MKTFIAMISAICLMSSCVKTSEAQINKEFETQNFNSIEMDGVGKIVYTQSDSYSIRAEGDSILVARTTIEFQDGHMTISQKGNHNNDSGLTIYISSPTLTKVETDGVGSFEAVEPVHFDNDFTFEMEGVGAVKISDLTCQNLKFHQDGVGAAEMKVSCNNAYYHAEGVGASKINIEADSLELINEGVGAMKVKGHVKHYSPHSEGVTAKISDNDLKVGE